MTDKSISEDICAKKFGEALKIVIRNLMTSDFERTKNLGATFSFNENNLRKHFSDCIKNTILLNSHPKLVVERKIEGDFTSTTKKHGGTDYFYVNEISDSYHHSEILATFELKGPTRPILLKGSKVNWYPAIILDIKKQLWRNINFANSSNYVVLLIKPHKKFDTHEKILSLFNDMENEISNVKLEECFWEPFLFRSAMLYISIFRVVSI